MVEWIGDHWGLDGRQPHLLLFGHLLSLLLHLPHYLLHLQLLALSGVCTLLELGGLVGLVELVGLVVDFGLLLAWAFGDGVYGLLLRHENTTIYIIFAYSN